MSDDPAIEALDDVVTVVRQIGQLQVEPRSGLREVFEAVQALVGTAGPRD